MKEYRKDFPIMNREINGNKLIYLDNGATTQKPKQVIDAISNFYSNYNANTHRGAYQLSLEASEAYEESKKVVAKFISADHWQEIVYTRNATESINLVANSLIKSKMLRKGDAVLISKMEHHSNIVPWLELQKHNGIILEFIELTENGELDYEDFENKVRGLRPKLVSIIHVSNTLGTINDVKRITKFSHDNGAMVLIDGAQAVPHTKVSVKEIDSDFYAFSGHKMCGPMGIGVLHGKKRLLEKMEPFMVGGDMISEVTFEDALWNDIPWKFEAGTQNVAGAVGLMEAVRYIEKIGIDNIEKHERELVKYAMEELSKIEGVTMYGPPAEKRAGLISFNLENIHPHDVSTVLDAKGIAIRSGNHCTQPLMIELGIIGSCRAAFYIYNSKDDVDKLIEGLIETKKIFGG